MLATGYTQKKTLQKQKEEEAVYLFLLPDSIRHVVDSCPLYKLDDEKINKGTRMGTNKIKNNRIEEKHSEYEILSSYKKNKQQMKKLTIMQREEAAKARGMATEVTLSIGPLR